MSEWTADQIKWFIEDQDELNSRCLLSDDCEKSLSMVKQLQSRLDKLEWHPVNKNNPEPTANTHPKQSEKVWLANSVELIEAYYDYYHHEWYDVNGSRLIRHSYTHWRYVDLPKEGDEG